MSSPQDRYLELFATEAREHLAQIGRALVLLEDEPDDRESIDAVFRSVHTIKGMAAALGFEDLTRLTHTFESALETIRSGGAVEPATIDVLLGAADLLEAGVGAATAGAEAPDPEATIAALKRLSEPGGSAREEETEGAGTPEDVAIDGASSRRVGSSRIRVDIRRLDALMNLIGELMIVRSRMERLASEKGGESLMEAVDDASRLVTAMQAEVVESRLVPVWQVFDRFPRLVRDVSRRLGKEVDLQISGKEIEIDRAMLDAISDPLVHLLRNAVDHGIEPPEERARLGKPRAGTIELSAERKRSRIFIEVRDDGRGVDRDRVIARASELGVSAEAGELTDRDLFRLMARPGFSTSEEVTTISGRGVGLNVVEDCARGFGGSIEFKTEPGKGTTFRIELPLTVAIVRALMVEAAGQELALPTAYARESFEMSETAVERAHGTEWIRWRGELLPLTRLETLFDMERSGSRKRNGASDGALKLVAMEVGGKRLAVSVDRFVDEREVVVKSFDPPRGALPIFSGATVRPDGQPALILDVAGLS